MPNIYFVKTHSRANGSLRLKYAQVLADNKESVILRPDVQMNKITNPEIELNNGWIADFKEPQPDESLKRSIESNFEDAKLQGCNVLIYVLKNKFYNKFEIIRALNNLIKPNKNLQLKETWFIFENKNLVEITRDEIEKKEYYSKLP